MLTCNVKKYFFVVLTKPWPRGGALFAVLLVFVFTYFVMLKKCDESIRLCITNTI